MKIMLDAGHANNTSGKRSPDGSLKEFEFNNPVAQMTRELLLRYSNVQVRFSHDPTGRNDIPLSARADAANSWGADLFVSIHANAFGNSFNDASGIETYIHINNTSKERALARNIQNELIIRTGRIDRGLKTADFAVLRETNMTAVLVECGFMTNREELALLKSTEYRKACAEGIVQGIVEYYNLQFKAKATAIRGGIRMYEPSYTAMVNSTARVLRRLENKEVHGEDAISPIHREKLLKGELPLDDAIGLLYVAFDRGLINGPKE